MLKQTPHAKPRVAKHGGRLRAAAKKYNIPTTNWLDLSTGINPNGWPVPSIIPNDCWQRLPEDEEDQFVSAAQQYYQCNSLIVLPGSQAGIQLLPRLRSPCRVLVRSNSYSEHALQWHAAGHQVNCVNAEQFESNVDTHDVVVVVNPDNPSGELIASSTLLAWHQRLSKRGGWLLVDEAFIDPAPSNSLAQHCPLSGLLILKSMGKFFGLAGIRAGALIAEYEILQHVSDHLGPWAISHPTRWVGTQAMLDIKWQAASRASLHKQSQQLQSVLAQLEPQTLTGTELFGSLIISNAASMHEQFALAGILTRLLNDHSGLRFGLPGSEHDLQRLETVITKVMNDTVA